MRFDGIAQPWLKEGAKRWTRARLLRGSTPGTMGRYLRDLAAFSGWLAEHIPEISSSAGVTRELLEDYLLWVRSGPWAMSTRRRNVSVLRQFLAEQCETGSPVCRAVQSSTALRCPPAITARARARAGRV